MSNPKGVIGQEQLDQYIEEAAKAAGYEEGFGVRGCDLINPNWWIAYCRQSLEEQAQNNRLPDYLRTCALEAKKLGVTVPREYVLYDAVTGEHLERPNMIRLRRLMAERRVAGVIFPALDRLSREPIHVGIFEFQAQHVGVRLHYADAPNGSDPMSQLVRMNIASAAKFVRLANKKNNRGGNIGRVIKGWVPAGRAAFGYHYRADREIGPHGRLIIRKAWWDINELGPDGQPLWGTPAWVVVQMFTWIGTEGRSLYWVARKLNETGIKAPQGGEWSPARVTKIVHHRCYTGNHAYNANTWVPNPDRPLGDITAEVKRTVLRPKPKDEWVEFRVPPLVSEGLWQKAIASIAERGRGRGKQGKSIQALLRSRVFCPKCGRPMVVQRSGSRGRVYYHCNKCDYGKFVPGTWDGLVWEDICRWLREDAWVEQQLASEQSQDENTQKLVRLQQFKISQAKAKLARVREGFEGGIYSLDEAKRRIVDLQTAIAKTESEIERLQQSTKASTSNKADTDAVRQKLKALRDKNLDEATFEEKLDIISMLGLKVYPSEDLKSMRVACQVDLERLQTQVDDGRMAPKEIQANGQCKLAAVCGKVTIA